MNLSEAKKRGAEVAEATATLNRLVAEVTAAGMEVTLDVLKMQSVDGTTYPVLSYGVRIDPLALAPRDPVELGESAKSGG